MPQGTPGCPTATVDQNLDHVGGFAKVFRKVWDHPYWQDAERFRAWIDCILLARWRDGYVMWRGRRVFVPRGSFRTSERELVARWGRSRKWVRLFLAEGEKYGELAVRKDQSGCHISLVNYERYHGTGTSEDTTPLINNGDVSRNQITGAPHVLEAPVLKQKKDQSKDQISLCSYEPYNEPGTSEGTAQGPPRDHPGTTQQPNRSDNSCGGNNIEGPFPAPEEVQEVEEGTTTPVGRGVDNSVDNPSMPRKVAEVVEAFQQASGSTKPPSIPDKLAVEKAIKANGGDHIPIRECVRKATAEGVAYAKQSGSDPPRGVRYGLAVWSRRNERGPDPRPAERREPESRPMSPAYHRPVKPVPTRRMTNDESRAGVKHVADVLKALLRPDRSGKK